MALGHPTRFLSQDGIVKAIDYCLKYWSGLTLFLKDLSVPLSNNDAERALRHVVMDRKNFAGSKSIDVADIATVLYTVGRGKALMVGSTSLRFRTPLGEGTR